VTTAIGSHCYVFAIVPAGTPVPAGDDDGPASGLTLVTAGDLAAVVGNAPADRPLGRAADLRAHDRVVADLVRAGAPVLPLRFGAVVTDQRAVVDELLLPHRAQFEETLGRLTGRVQYTVRVQYEEDTVLRQVLAARPDIRRLRDRAGHDRSAQLRLGELVVGALERLRQDDGAAIMAELIGTVDVRVHEPSAPDEVLHAAFLVDVDTSAEFEDQVTKAAAERAGRTRFRLVGPSAAYDFIGDT